jgi:hypothetical protein
MWGFFQLLVMFAVGGTNIVYEWTDNGYVVSFFGFIAAMLATIAMSFLLSLPGLVRSIFRRCFGAETHSDRNASRHVDRLPRSTWRPRDTPEDFRRPRIGYDPS